MNFYRHHLINNIHIPNILNTLNLWLKNLSTDFTLNHCLFGYVKLTMLFQINTNTAANTEDLILVQNFSLEMEAREKILLFLELI